MQDAVVVRLGDTDKLAVVALGAHHPRVVQLLHRRRDPEAVAEVQLTHVPVLGFNLHLAVDDDGPGVQLLAVRHDDGAGLLHNSKDHGGHQGPPHRQRHVREGLQMLRKLQQNLDVVLVSVRGVLFQAVADRVADCEVAHGLGQVFLFVRVDDGLHEAGEVDLLHLDGALHAVHGVGAAVGGAGVAGAPHGLVG